jgi:hypothetical protein
MHLPRSLACSAAVVTLGISAPTVGAEQKSASDGVRVTRLDDRLKIEINGELFGEYHFRGDSRPYLYPILAPGGVPITRDWPMKDSPDEEHDHPHHRSFWFAHGDINGQDFWSEESKAGRTVHLEFTEIKSGPDAGVIRSRNQLVAKDGTIVGTEDFTLRIYNVPGARQWDFEVTLHASKGELKLGDTKEGTMALRLAETMRLAPNKFNAGKPTGHIVNSEGLRDGQTWGKRAKWVDYHGPVQAQTLGVAIFDHPSNPRHPTWWHVRDYGLFAANPFGLHDFEKQPPGSGNLKIPAGQSLTFRYRFYLHAGDEKEGKVAERYQDYTTSAAQP